MQVEEIERLVSLVRESKVRELTLREGVARITIRQSNGATVADYIGDVPQSADIFESAPEASEEGGETERDLDETAFITSPCVGFFHYGKKPVGVGTTVGAGQVVGVIEAMQILNEVRSLQKGTIREVLIEEGLPAEYGQPLFIVEPLGE